MDAKEEEAHLLRELDRGKPEVKKPPDDSDDSPTCSQHHNAKKKIYCQTCEKFFCCRCMIIHIQKIHEVMHLQNIDQMKAKFTGSLEEEIDEYKGMMKELKAQKHILVKEAAAFRSDKGLEDHHKKLEEWLREVFTTLKQDKNGHHKNMTLLLKRMDNKELDLERAYNALEADQKDIEQGNSSTLFRWNKNFHKRIERQQEKKELVSSQTKMFAEAAEKIKESTKLKDEETTKMVQSVESGLIQRFYEVFCSATILKHTKTLQEYEEEIMKVKQKSEKHREEAEKMGKIQEELKTGLQELQKQIADGKSYLKNLNLQSFKDQEADLKKTIAALKKSKEAIEADNAARAVEKESLSMQILEKTKVLEEMKKSKKEATDVKKKIENLKKTAADIQTTQVKTKGELDEAKNTIEKIQNTPVPCPVCGSGVLPKDIWICSCKKSCCKNCHIPCTKCLKEKCKDCLKVCERFNKLKCEDCRKKCDEVSKFYLP